MQPSVSVVVPARNEEELIGGCLKSILSQEPQPLEVILVDNGSTDRTAEIAKALGARVIYQPNPGVHIARQTGLEAARGDIIASTDADCIVKPGWIRAIVQGFSEPQVVETYGGLEYFDAPLLDRLSAKYGYPLFLAIMNWLGQPNTAGANQAVRRETALKVGGYDVPLGEDIQLTHKLKSHGKIKYVPDQRVLTSGRRLKGGRLKMYATHLRNIWRRLQGREQDYGKDYHADRDK